MPDTVLCLRIQQEIRQTESKPFEVHILVDETNKQKKRRQCTNKLIINYDESVKKTKSWCSGPWGVLNTNGVVREGFTEEVSFKSHLKDKELVFRKMSELISEMHKSIPGKKSNAKALRWDRVWLIWGTTGARRWKVEGEEVGEFNQAHRTCMAYWE